MDLDFFFSNSLQFEFESCPAPGLEPVSSQALPGLKITAPPPVLVPAVLGALALWMSTPPTKGSAAESEQKQEPNQEKLDNVKTLKLEPVYKHV